MIASKYANPEVARRNLEVLAAATLEATLRPASRRRGPSTSRRWTSCRRPPSPPTGLVHETDGLSAISGNPR